ASGRTARASGLGRRATSPRHYPRPFLYLACLLLLLANVFNIAADLAGMGDAVEMLSCVTSHVWVPSFGVVLIVVTVYTSYATFARSLKWLTAVLLAYLVAAVLSPPDWRTAL